MYHFSFDFWNTVAKPNSDFALNRTWMLHELFGVSLNDAAAIYTRVKKVLDTRAETEGQDRGRAYNLRFLCMEMGYPNFASDGFESLPQKVGRMLDELFVLFPPTIDPKLIEQLHRAREMGVTLSIGSNTNFISGTTIEDRVLQNLPFAFKLFSDLEGVAKPHPQFFDKMIRGAQHANPKLQSNHSIIHIGDSLVCDISGATNAGIMSMHVKNASMTASRFSSFLDMIS